MDKKVIKSSRPNGHSLKLIEFNDDGETTYQVATLVEEDYNGWDEHEVYYGDSLAEAESAYEAELATLRDTPNWAAQSRYDEEHGTVNGYDPDVLRWNEEFGGEY